MKKIFWLCVAIAFILGGCAIFSVAMSKLGWDFTKLSTIKQVTNEYEVCESYRDISITAIDADVTLIPSQNGETRVVCLEDEKVQHSVSVKDGVLVIEAIDNRDWYNHIGFNFKKAEISVYVPAGTYGDLSIDTDTGDVEISGDFEFLHIDVSGSTSDVTNRATATESVKIEVSTGDVLVENISTGWLEISVSTGDTKIKNVSCDTFVTKGSTGDLDMANVLVSGKMSVNRSTGDVEFFGCDASEISIETDTGNVSGSLLTSKIFVTDTSTGKIDVPKSTTGGLCEITTSTGDIHITVD